MTAPPTLAMAPAKPGPSMAVTPIRVGFVMHWMRTAGAEMLVARIIQQLGNRLRPSIFCLDEIGDLGTRLQQEGIDVVCVNRRPGKDWGAVGRLAQLFRERQIDVIHAHQYTPFFYAALARLWGSRRSRLIMTEHGRHYPDIVSAKRRWINRLLLARQADAVNACCKFSGEALARLDGFQSRPVQVIYNGVDPQEFQPADDRLLVRSELGLKPDRRYVAMVARFHPVKDHQMLIAAFAQAAAALPDVDLLLVGDGPLRETLTTQVQQAGIADRVQFWGVRRDVAKILQAVDLFALTSVSEAASLTLLEAMSSGCPVLVTDVGGNPEIVTQGVAGLRVPRGDSAAAAKALVELMADPARCHVMGAAGRKRILADFDQSQTVQQFADLYEQLAPAGGRCR